MLTTRKPFLEMKSQRTKKAWAGRFAEGAHPLMEEFTSSLHFDKKLAVRHSWKHRPLPDVSETENSHTR